MTEHKFKIGHLVYFHPKGVGRVLTHQERCRLLQIARIEPFGQPAVDHFEKAFNGGAKIFRGAAAVVRHHDGIHAVLAAQPGVFP